MLPCHLEVAYIPFEMGGPQPGLYLFTQAARMMRPVKQNSSQAPELIGTLEQYNMSIWSVPNPITCPYVACCHVLENALTMHACICTSPSYVSIFMRIVPSLVYCSLVIVVLLRHGMQADQS